jgi:hypothetical protein
LESKHTETEKRSSRRPFVSSFEDDDDMAVGPACKKNNGERRTWGFAASLLACAVLSWPWPLGLIVCDSGWADSNELVWPDLLLFFYILKYNLELI